MGDIADWWKKNIEDPIVELYEYAVDHFDDYVESTILPQFENNPVAEWLYADDWSKGKFALYTASHGVPLVGSYFDWLLGMRSAQEYLDRYDLDWSDIHNPNKLPGGSNGSSAALVRGGLNFVSDNIKRLYH